VNLHIVGTGLIGASIGLAAKRAGAAERVTGSDPDAEALRVALARGAIDEEAEPEADLVVVCVPVTALAETVRRLLTAGDATVTDVGSTKAAVSAAAQGSPR